MAVAAHVTAARDECQQIGFLRTAERRRVRAARPGVGEPARLVEQAEDAVSVENRAWMAKVGPMTLEDEHGPRDMTRVAMLDDVAAERLALADELADLTDEQWATPSLCPGWTVRDVAAHLTLSTRTTVPRFVWATLRARGDVDRAFADEARERARRFSTGELVGQLREMAHVDRRLRLSGPLDPLNDLLVHRQDIAVPLGHVVDPPVERVAPCLPHTWSAPFVGAAKRFAGLRLVATDCDWIEGEGPELRGPSSGMILALNGRRAGLDRLEGPGLAEARRRFQPL